MKKFSLVKTEQKQIQKTNEYIYNTYHKRRIFLIYKELLNIDKNQIPVRKTGSFKQTFHQKDEQMTLKQIKNHSVRIKKVFSSQVLVLFILILVGFRREE